MPFARRGPKGVFSKMLTRRVRGSLVWGGEYLMKSLATLPILSFCFLASSLADDAKPAAPRPRPMPVISPEIHADGGVTFRYKAPKAQEVKVQGQFGKDTALTKGEDGVWSVTIPAVPAGIHEYRFLLDGVAVMDAQNPAIKPQRWPNTSILHIPASPPALWDQREIPHGVVHQHDYKSRALGKWRRIFVYTPPGEASGPLPVLYLAHGYSDNEGTWTTHGKAHWILDSLIAEKKTLPMMIVMPDAHAVVPGEEPFETYGVANTNAFCRELTEDIIPLVERTYPVDKRREGRAFAGLSMGGHHALTVALRHHESFGWVGAFSAAPPPESMVAEGLGSAEAVNSHLRLFWIGCGKKDFLFEKNNVFSELLKTKGIKHEYAVTEGDHSWPIWRSYLADLAPKLFR